MDDDYINQVQLLIQLLPYIAKEEVFALKGGTAINLFHVASRALVAGGCGPAGKRSP